MIFQVSNRWQVSALLAAAVTLSGCQHINVAQITYEMLRADDCRRNQLEDFCGRTYASDYHEYTRLRKEFIRYQQETAQRPSPDGLTLQNVPNTL